MSGAHRRSCPTRLRSSNPRSGQARSAIPGNRPVLVIDEEVEGIELCQLLGQLRHRVHCVVEMTVAGTVRNLADRLAINVQPPGEAEPNRPSTEGIEQGPQDMYGGRTPDLALPGIIANNGMAPLRYARFNIRRSSRSIPTSGACLILDGKILAGDLAFSVRLLYVG